MASSYDPISVGGSSRRSSNLSTNLVLQVSSVGLHNLFLNNKHFSANISNGQERVMWFCFVTIVLIA